MFWGIGVSFSNASKAHFTGLKSNISSLKLLFYLQTGFDAISYKVIA